MLVNLKGVSRKLLQLPRAGCSYFENFTDKINPPPKAALSYHNPKYRGREDKQKYIVELNSPAKKLIQESKFMRFKEKMIGINKEIELIMPDDPLWGAEAPIHYIQTLPIHAYNKIRPYNGKFVEKPVPSQLRSKSEVIQSLNYQNLAQCSPFNIIQFALRQSQLELKDDSLKVFTKVERLVGGKLHLLSTIDIVRLRHALLGAPKYGSPQLHSKLTAIVNEEYMSLDVNGLLAAFATMRYDKKEDMQVDILNRLLTKKNLQQLSSSPDSLLEFLECYAQYRLPDWKKPRKIRVRSESKLNGISLLSKFPIEKLIPFFTVQQKLRLMRVFKKMKVEGFKNILHLITSTTNQAELTPKEAIEYLYLLSVAENKEGYIKEHQLDDLKGILLESWGQFDSFQQLRICHIYWDLNSSWEEFQPLYAQIPVEADPNLLFHFVEIEITDSSGREHEIVRAISELDVIPIPYFGKFKQFEVFARSFRWNLTPIRDKYEQTQNFVNVEKTIENLLKDQDYIKLGQFLITIPARLESVVPVENFTIVQYAYEELLIGIEANNARDFAPNGSLKKSVVARNTTLESLGWHIIQVRWDELTKLPIHKRYEFIKSKVASCIEVQKARKQQREAQESVVAMQLTRVRQFQYLDYEDFDDFLDGVNPTQRDFQLVLAGQEPVDQLPVLQEAPRPAAASKGAVKENKSKGKKDKGTHK